MPTLVIADDHPLFRAALRQAARDALGEVELFEAGTLEAVLALLDAQPQVDLHMPGNHGLAGLAAVRAQYPGVAVIVISANDDPRVIRRALDHGAAGYLPKSAGLDDLRDAIRCVLACDTWLPPALRASVTRAQSSPNDAALAARLASLSPQQFREPALAEQLSHLPAARANGHSRPDLFAFAVSDTGMGMAPDEIPIANAWACATAPRPGWSCANWNCPTRRARSRAERGCQPASSRFGLEVGQVQAQVELQLVVVGHHVRAQLVERLVVLEFLQVRQFVHHDHLQECSGGVAEHRGDADLAAGLEPAAVHPRGGGVGAERHHRGARAHRAGRC